MKIKTLIFIFISFPFSLYAQQAPTSPVSAGIGIALKNNIRKDNQAVSYKSTIVNALPIAQIYWGPIQINHNGLSVNFLGNPFLGAYVNLNRQGDRYYGPGMDPRYESWFGGIGIKIWKFNTLLGKDINGNSKGKRLFISFGHLYTFNEQLSLRFNLAAENLDTKMMNYYYGVRQNEVTMDRSYYMPSDSWQFQTGASFIYRPHPKWSSTLGISFKPLSSKVKNSPTVTKEFEFGQFFGITYAF